MIKFSWKKLPVDADGKAYDSLEAFQAAQLASMVSGMTEAVAKIIVENKEQVLEILTLTMDARPAARGQKRPRKPKTPEQQAA